MGELLKKCEFRRLWCKGWILWLLAALGLMHSPVILDLFRSTFVEQALKRPGPLILSDCGSEHALLVMNGVEASH